MYTSRLLKFQEQILLCDQFDTFWTELILFCQQEVFLQQSIPALHPALRNTLEQLARQRMYKDNAPIPSISNFLLLHYAPANFFHGMVNINGHMACILYFGNTGVGMISVCENFFPPETTLIRFCIAIKNTDIEEQ